MDELILFIISLYSGYKVRYTELKIRKTSSVNDRDTSRKGF